MTPPTTPERPLTVADQPSPHRIKMCDGKSVYESRAKAEAAQAAVFARSREIVYPYRCAYCKFWHVGHPQTGKITASVGDYNIGAPGGTIVVRPVITSDDLLKSKQMIAERERERNISAAERKAINRAKNAAFCQQKALRRDLDAWNSRDKKAALQSWENEGGLFY